MDSFVRTLLLVILFLLVVAGTNMLLRMAKPPIRKAAPKLGAFLDFVSP